MFGAKKISKTENIKISTEPTVVTAKPIPTEVFTYIYLIHVTETSFVSIVQKKFSVTS